jgi:hypothetical protein
MAEQNNVQQGAEEQEAALPKPEVEKAALPEPVPDKKRKAYDWSNRMEKGGKEMADVYVDYYKNDGRELFETVGIHAVSKRVTKHRICDKWVKFTHKSKELKWEQAKIDAYMDAMKRQMKTHYEKDTKIKQQIDDYPWLESSSYQKGIEFCLWMRRAGCWYWRYPLISERNYFSRYIQHIHHVVEDTKDFERCVEDHFNEEERSKFTPPFNEWFVERTEPVHITESADILHLFQGLQCYAYGAELPTVVDRYMKSVFYNYGRGKPSRSLKLAAFLRKLNWTDEMEPEKIKKEEVAIIRKSIGGTEFLEFLNKFGNRQATLWEICQVCLKTEDNWKNVFHKDFHSYYGKSVESIAEEVNKVNCTYFTNDTMGKKKLLIQLLDFKDNNGNLITYDKLDEHIIKKCNEMGIQSGPNKKLWSPKTNEKLKTTSSPFSREKVKINLKFEAEQDEVVKDLSDELANLGVQQQIEQKIKQ